MLEHFFNTRKIYIFAEEVDLRKSIDGLTAHVKEAGYDPLDPDACYLFTNRRHNRIKALSYDGTGQLLLLKRLNEKTFCWRFKEEGVIAISARQLAWLLEGLSIHQKRAIEQTHPRYV